MNRIILITLAGLILCGGNLLAASISCDQAVIDKLIDMYDIDSSRFTVEVLKNPLKNSSVTSADIVLRPLTQKEPRGLFNVIARIVDDGEVIESGQVRLRIREFSEVVVLSEKLRRHQTLTEGVLEIRRMDITSLIERPVEEIKSVLGQRSRRNMKRGQILTTSAVQPIPDVSSGREVTIIYSGGLFRVSAIGIVMQDGIAGEYIRVKNKSSGKIILARVVSADAVAVDL